MLYRGTVTSSIGVTEEVGEILKLDKKYTEILWEKDVQCFWWLPSKSYHGNVCIHWIFENKVEISKTCTQSLVIRHWQQYRSISHDSFEKLKLRNVSQSFYGNLAKIRGTLARTSYLKRVFVPKKPKNFCPTMSTDPKCILEYIDITKPKREARQKFLRCRLNYILARGLHTEKTRQSGEKTMGKV